MESILLKTLIFWPNGHFCQARTPWQVLEFGVFQVAHKWDVILSDCSNPILLTFLIPSKHNFGTCFSLASIQSLPVWVWPVGCMKISRYSNMEGKFCIVNVAWCIHGWSSKFQSNHTNISYMIANGIISTFWKFGVHQFWVLTVLSLGPKKHCLIITM